MVFRSNRQRLKYKDKSSKLALISSSRNTECTNYSKHHDSCKCGILPSGNHTTPSITSTSSSPRLYCVNLSICLPLLLQLVVQPYCVEDLIRQINKYILSFVFFPNCRVFPPPEMKMAPRCQKHLFTRNGNPMRPTLLGGSQTISHVTSFFSFCLSPLTMRAMLKKRKEKQYSVCRRRERRWPLRQRPAGYSHLTPCR